MTGSGSPYCRFPILIMTLHSNLHKAATRPKAAPRALPKEGRKTGSKINCGNAALPEKAEFIKNNSVPMPVYRAFGVGGAAFGRFVAFDRSADLSGFGSRRFLPMRDPAADFGRSVFGYAALIHLLILGLPYYMKAEVPFFKATRADTPCLLPS